MYATNKKSNQAITEILQEVHKHVTAQLSIVTCTSNPSGIWNSIIGVIVYKPFTYKTVILVVRYPCQAYLYFGLKLTTSVEYLP